MSLTTRIYSADKTPFKPYTEVESEFIREQIRRRSFDDPEDRIYVNKLVNLEYFILNPAQSYSSGMYFNALKRRLKDEHDRILKDLKPEEYQKRKAARIENRRKKEEKRKEREREKARELEEARKQWERVEQEGAD
ncbi:MAG: hypothetical protein SVV03_04445 [Candidatus Nanohaloarchaea archaeon]|nr:hypothetical protein [Candidatus Nanohaloarchaea archaeon]